MAHERELLRKAVMNAFAEGFHMGQEHGNTNWKYPPLNLAWFLSHTRGVFKLPIPERIRQELEAWMNSRADECDKFEKQLKDPYID